ncbi:hypothetical protein B0H14DRAFT_3858296 [Mycena olivaceomarginata]|nr:hypothetical protein B0H14DRAFT_3858296 [Mycena olivaceomarginata]
MADVKNRTFSSLQLEVSAIRKASLHSSLSHYAMLCDFLKGRTFTVLCCLHKVHELETHIEEGISSRDFFLNVGRWVLNNSS